MKREEPVELPAWSKGSPQMSLLSLILGMYQHQQNQLAAQAREVWLNIAIRAR
jgi:hypothetical protein